MVAVLRGSSSMSPSVSDLPEPIDNDENSSSAVYAMKKTLESIQKIRKILSEQPERLGEKYKSIQEELDAAEELLDEHITTYLQKADREPPNINKYDGVELNPVIGFLKRRLNSLMPKRYKNEQKG